MNNNDDVNPTSKHKLLFAEEASNLAFEPIAHYSAFHASAGPQANTGRLKAVLARPDRYLSAVNPPASSVHVAESLGLLESNRPWHRSEGAVGVRPE